MSKDQVIKLDKDSFLPLDHERYMEAIEEYDSKLGWIIAGDILENTMDRSILKPINETKKNKTTGKTK